MDKNRFKKEWDESDQKTAEYSIYRFINVRIWRSHKSGCMRTFYGSKDYCEINRVLGLVYEIHPEGYAGLWACNDKLFLDEDKIYFLNGFVIDPGKNIFAEWINNDNHELYIQIN